jgi:hypothetical protein
MFHLEREPLAGARTDQRPARSTRAKTIEWLFSFDAECLF